MSHVVLLSLLAPFQNIGEFSLERFESNENRKTFENAIKLSKFGCKGYAGACTIKLFTAVICGFT